MVPLFALGIPASGTTAIMLGGFLMLGLQPGPLLFQQHPEFVWPVIGTFYTGNLMLVVLTTVMVPFLAAIVFVPTAVLFPLICGIVHFGVFSLNFRVFDVWLALGLGVLGYLFKRLNYPVVPVLLGLVLGPLLEQAVRRALIMSDGDPRIFVDSWLSISLLAITACLLLYPLWLAIRAYGNARHAPAPG